MVTYFVVQPYLMGKRGAIIAETPIQASGVDHALRMAEKLAPQRQAVVAFSRTGEPSTGEWDAAIVLAVHGHVPEGIEEEFAAA
jgi:hypothetical protein